MTAVLSQTYLQTELLQLWRSLLSSNDVTIDDDFFDSGGDSLLATELVTEIERRVGASVPDSLLFEASTVRRLAERLSASAKIEARTISEISPTGQLNPLLFFHGDWTDGGFYVKSFARCLGSKQPLTAVAPHGADGEEIPGTLVEMAADRLPAVLKTRPRGPYRLGGHCVGAMVALEVARLLVASGREIEVVAMIDPIWTASGTPWPALRPPTTGPITIGQNGEPILFSQSEPTEASWQRYEEVLATYRPLPISVPIVVFASAFDGRPWGELSSKFKLFEASGGHYDWITTRAPDFASRLREHLGLANG